MERSKTESNELHCYISYTSCGVVYKLNWNTTIENTCMIEQHPQSRKYHDHDVVLCPDIMMQADRIEEVEMILAGIVIVTPDFIGEGKASAQFMKAAM